jgi:hypothetical protein
MDFWLYIDSKEQEGCSVLTWRRGTCKARQGKARQRRKEDKCETSKVAFLDSPPPPNYVTKQNEEKNDIISKGTRKENKRKKGKTRNRIHFAIVGSTAPPLDFMHSFHSVDFFFNWVGFCLRRAAELGM